MAGIGCMTQVRYIAGNGSSSGPPAAKARLDVSLGQIFCNYLQRIHLVVYTLIIPIFGNPLMNIQ